MLFFNSPFGFPVRRRVAEHLEQAPRSNGRSYLIFMNYRWIAEAGAFIYLR